MASARGLWAFMLAMVLFTLATGARAAEERCEGRCCVVDITRRLPQRPVRLSVAFVGLYEIDDHANTWTADYWLYESWPATEGLRPQTEVVNEVERIAESSDVTEEVNGRCLRARRIRSKLHSPYDFRAFPFDQQRLALTVSESTFQTGIVTYEARPGQSGVDDPVLRQLSGWTISPKLTYTEEARGFAYGFEGSKKYAYATFGLTVSRRYGYHLAKFFLPLFIIVALSFAVFFIDPEDLQSQIGLGITGLLAAIAFQLTQAGSLPEVEYLTLADRVFIACYVAIALSMVESCITNALTRRGQRNRAHRLDRFSRWAFPVALAISVTAFGLLAGRA